MKREVEPARPPLLFNTWWYWTGIGINLALLVYGITRGVRS